MGILSSKYRTNVLYDFSLVSKAVFYIYERSYEGLSGAPLVLKGGKKASMQFPDSFELKDILPVQINPEDVRLRYGGKLYNDYNSGQPAVNLSKKYDGFSIKRKSSDMAGEESLNISLKYDIYDEYMVSTAEGLVTTDKSPSLLNHNTTSLEQLCKYSGKPDVYALFEWGEIECFGIMESIDVTFDAFSCWGTPLKASVEVEISKQILAVDDDYGEISPKESGCLALSGGKHNILTYRKTSDILLKTQLGVSQALR